VERWRASFDTDPELADALADALGRVIASERLDLVTGLMADDRPVATIAFTVAATGGDEAVARARDDVGRAVQRGGLPEGLVPDPADVRLIRPGFALPLDEQLMMGAQQLAIDGQNDTAVPRAQAACEVYAEKVLQDLAVRRGGEKLFRRIKPRAFSLSDGRAIALFYLLTGEWIDDEPWWGDYDRHVQRRHRIIHAGGLVSAEEADESLDAADAFRRYLREALARVLGTEVDPANSS
jgi:hypothetical protein